MSYDEFHPRKIRVYKNGDEFFMGKRIILNERIYRSFEQVSCSNQQFILALSKEIDLKSGAVRRIYDMNGKQVKTLEDLVDGTFYVASSGEPFKRVQYATEENGVPISVNSMRNLALPLRTDTRGRRHINASTGGLLEEDPKIHSVEPPIFTPSTKAMRIGVFENGEVNAQGLKLVLSYRNCKNFEQLIRFLSSHIVLKTGQIRKIYDAQTGKRIKSLKDLEPGHNIVVASHEPFKRGNYQVQNLVPEKKVKREYSAGKVVTFYPNGDSYHSGFNLTINKRRFPVIQRLFDHLNSQIELVTGKIQKIYTLEGNRIFSIEEFEKSKGYVLVANDDPFIKTRYNILKVTYHRLQPLNGTTLKNEFMDKIRPVTVRKSQRRIEARTIHYDHEKYDPGVSKKVNPKTPRKAVDSEVESGLDTDNESPRQKKQPTRSRSRQEIEEDYQPGGEEIYGNESLSVMNSKNKNPKAKNEEKAKQVPSKPASAQKNSKDAQKSVNTNESKKPTTSTDKKANAVDVKKQPNLADEGKRKQVKKLESDGEFEAELIPVSKPSSAKKQASSKNLKEVPKSPPQNEKSKPQSPVESSKSPKQTRSKVASAKLQQEETDDEDEEFEVNNRKSVVKGKPQDSRATSPKVAASNQTSRAASPKPDSRPMSPANNDKTKVKSTPSVEQSSGKLASKNDVKSNPTLPKSADGKKSTADMNTTKSATLRSK